MLLTLRGLRRRLEKGLARHGLVGSVVHAVGRARDLVQVTTHRRRDVRELGLDHGFDGELGLDTGGTISLSDLDIASANWIYGLCYVASAAPRLQEVLGRLPLRHEDFVFIDLGSGKGRALLIASHFPFRRIVGVEFSPALHAIAVQNIGRYRTPARRCHDVTSICEDAARYSLPDVPLVVYLYRPFEDNVLATVLAGLRASLARVPRPVFVVYNNPPAGNALESADFLRPLWSDAGLEYAVYATR